MKIAICTNHYLPQIGGCEFVVKALSEYLVSMGHQVHVITRKHIGRNKSLFKYKIHEYLQGDLALFNKTINTIKPDILFIYSDVFDFFHFLLVEPKKFKTVVATCGGNWINSNKSRANVFERNAQKLDGIICHSTRDVDYKICHNIKLDNKMVVIPNGVDLTEFDSNTITRNQLLPKHLGKYWIINISNFFPGKGQNFIFDIINLVPRKEEIVYIQICSTIQYEIGKLLEQKWQALSKEQGFTSILFKDIERQKLVGMLKNSNIFICPSEKEVAPLVLLEAMACGVPWVSADVGNTRDLAGGKYIATAKTKSGASIFDDRVLNMFAQHISEYMKNQSDGKNGRKQIENEMNWEIILPKYVEIFQRLTSA